MTIYCFVPQPLLQTAIHLASTSPIAVMARFTAIAVQMAIATTWAIKLLGV